MTYYTELLKRLDDETVFVADPSECAKAIRALVEQVKEYDKALLDIIRGDKAHVDQVFAVRTKIKAMGDKPMNTLSPYRDPAYAMDEDSNE